MRFLLLLIVIGLTYPLPGQGIADLSLSRSTIPENEDLMTLVGTLTAIGAADNTSYTFTLTDNTQTPGNAYFRIRGDSLYSWYSFDYEASPVHWIRIRVTDDAGRSLEKLLPIEVTDLQGKWDRDGWADAELAAKYPQVNPGDYVIFNQSVNKEIYKNGGEFSGLRYPNKILVKGGRYHLVHLRLNGVVGRSVVDRIPITNFLGQVYTRHFRVYDGALWRLTGQYDADRGTGSPFFRGCDQNGSTVDFTFSRGTFGIWVSNEWTSESGLSNLSVDDMATHFEIDHLEISDGGFAGVLIKDDFGPQDMDQVYLHHLYIHDIGSEGIYLGSTQADPQHMFHDLIIENCVIVRTGSEALQTEQLGARCVIRNNVLWGALDWQDPFQRFQDNTVQFSVRSGGLIFERNILLGAGEKFFNVSHKIKSGLHAPALPVQIRQNLAWACRGPFGAYQFKDNDARTPWVWEENFWGRFINSYDKVYPDHYTHATHIFSIAANNIPVTLRNNVFDQTRSEIGGPFSNSTARFTFDGNRQEAIPEPIFANALGVYGQAGFLRWMRWAETIGSSPSFPSFLTNKGQPVTFAVGDIVQYWHRGETRFYLCLQEHQGIEPDPDDASVWQLLTWNKNGDVSYYPPDDWRLSENSPYQSYGMGLQDRVRPCFTPVGMEARSLPRHQFAGGQGGSTSPSVRYLPCKDQWASAPPSETEEGRIHLPGRNGRIRPAVTVVPNPVADRARIELDLAQTGQIRISLLNPLGQIERVIVPKQMLAAGVHVFSFERNGLPPGYYQIVIEDLHEVISHPIIMMRRF
jgi:hypothetical protein